MSEEKNEEREVEEKMKQEQRRQATSSKPSLKEDVFVLMTMANQTLIAMSLKHFIEIAGSPKSFVVSQDSKDNNRITGRSINKDHIFYSETLSSDSMISFLDKLKFKNPERMVNDSLYLRILTRPTITK